MQRTNLAEQDEFVDAVAAAVCVEVSETLAALWKRDFELLRREVKALAPKRVDVSDRGAAQTKALAPKRLDDKRFVSDPGQRTYSGRSGSAASVQHSVIQELLLQELKPWSPSRAILHPKERSHPEERQTLKRVVRAGSRRKTGRTVEKVNSWKELNSKGATRSCPALPQLPGTDGEGADSASRPLSPLSASSCGSSGGPERDTLARVVPADSCQRLGRSAKRVAPRKPLNSEPVRPASFGSFGSLADSIQSCGTQKLPPTCSGLFSIGTLMPQERSRDLMDIPAESDEGADEETGWPAAQPRADNATGDSAEESGAALTQSAEEVMTSEEPEPLKQVESEDRGQPLKAGWSRFSKRSSRCSSISTQGTTIDQLRQANNKYWIDESCCAMPSSSGEQRSEEEPSGVTVGRPWLRARAALPGSYECLFLALPRMCGLVPWSVHHRRLASVYQVLLVVLVLASMVRGLAQQQTRSAALFLDTVLGTGSVLSLMASLRSRERILYWDSVLANHVTETRLPLAEESAVSWTVTAAAWLAAVGLRVHHGLAHDAGLPNWHFALSSFILLGMTLYFRNVAMVLWRSLDGYCWATFDHANFEHAELRWNFVQAVIRTSCTSMERCFVLTQATGMVALVASAGIVDWTERDLILQSALPLVPGALVALGINKVLLDVAFLTDKCDRVPSIIGLLPTGKELDVDRFHLVQHIGNGQTGFYVFGVRLNSAVVLKLIYLTCVLIVAIGTRSQTHG